MGMPNTSRPELCMSYLLHCQAQEGILETMVTLYMIGKYRSHLVLNDNWANNHHHREEGEQEILQIDTLVSQEQVTH